MLYGGVRGSAQTVVDWVAEGAPRGLCDELDSWSLPVHAEDSLRAEVAVLGQEAVAQFEDKHEKRLQQKVSWVCASLC